MASPCCSHMLLLGLHGLLKFHPAVGAVHCSPVVLLVGCCGLQMLLENNMNYFKESAADPEDWVHSPGGSVRHLWSVAGRGDSLAAHF